MSKVELTFVSTVKGMTLDEKIKPQKIKMFYPEWLKKMPSKIKQKNEWGGNVDLLTAKTCPSFIHWFQNGWVIPAWADMRIQHNPETGTWYWRIGREMNSYKVDIHDDEQLLNYADVNFLGHQPSKVFKLVCPWRLITPSGYSVYQMPMFYHFDEEWITMPGIIDTDVWHEINQQILYFGNGKEVFIKKGTPIAHYIPFKREESVMELREETAEDNLYFEGTRLKVLTEDRAGYLNLDRSKNGN
jgi:hypothetical protein